jgi:hypothetical protein
MSEAAKDVKFVAMILEAIGLVVIYGRNYGFTVRKP